MPPVPSSCAAIMRSASPGPRSMRSQTRRHHRQHDHGARRAGTQPSAPPGRRASAAPGRASSAPAARRPAGRRRGSDRRARRSSSPHGTVPGSRLVSVVNTLRAAPGGKPADRRHEPGAQRQARIERAPRDIDPGDDGLPQEAQQQQPADRAAAGRQGPRRQQPQADPRGDGRREDIDDARGQLMPIIAHHISKNTRRARKDVALRGAAPESGASSLARGRLRQCARACGRDAPRRRDGSAASIRGRCMAYGPQSPSGPAGEAQAWPARRP